MKKKMLLGLCLLASVTITVAQGYYQPQKTTTYYGSSYGSNHYGNRSKTSNTTIEGYNIYSTPSITYQSGYYRNNGTYVQGHYKTRSNNTNHDNFSTNGNYNIYTGTSGYVARDYTPQTYNYGSGKTIYTGSRGGQYYINSNGNKTYVPKRR